MDAWSSPLPQVVSEVVATLGALLLGFILLRFYWFVEAQHRKLHKLPPGPRPWPVVGNALGLQSTGNHRFLAAFATKYGGLMYLRLGCRPCIVVSTAAVAKEFYKTIDASFASRPKMFAWTVWNENDPNYRVLALSQGPYWRRLKKFLTAEIYSPTRLASHRGLRAGEIQHMVSVLLGEVGDQALVNLKFWCYGVGFNHMTRIITGKRYFGTSGPDTEKQRKDLKDMSDGLFELFGTVVISDFVPYLSFITRLQGYPAYLAKARDFGATLADKILDLEGHRQRALERGDGDPDYVPDFVDVLATTPFDDGLPLSHKDVKCILQEMLNGGSETASTTAEWVMAELATKPDLIKRAQKELDGVIRTPRLVEEADLPHLPFLQALVKETVRLHPPVPLLLPHQSHEPSQLLGYHIPAGTMLIVNAYAVHRDPDVYAHPERFDPDRFVTHEEVNHLKGTDSYELLPFGKGRRMCPGYSMGNIMVHLMLAHLLYVFDWALPDGQTTVDMSEFHGLTTSMKTSLRLLATPRIQLDLP